MTPNPENPDPGPNAPRILVVDDDPVALQVVRNILGLEGMVVVVAASGHEALTRMDAGEVFDLVLLDGMVTGRTDFELCREIRRRYKHDELPVLLLVDKKRLTELTEGLNNGANDCLGKPFAREELLARVYAQLKVRAAHEMALENNRLRCELELRIQAESALHLGHQRLDRMLHALPAPMVAIKESLEIAFCTRAFAERCGYCVHDLLGRSAQTLFGASSETLETWFAVLENPEALLPAGGAFFLLVAADGAPWSCRIVPAALMLETESLLLLLLDETSSVAASLRWIHDLSRNRRLLQRMEETFNGLSPPMSEQYPGFMDELHVVDRSLARICRELTPDAPGQNPRQMIVKVMQLALDLWAEATLSTKADLARRSGQWAVYVNQDGWERTQTLDRYLSLHTLPARPRLKKVLLTGDFVLANAPAETSLRKRCASALARLRELH